MARIIRVNVTVCHNEQTVIMFRNVRLDMTHIPEDSNRGMNQAFEEQHPVLLSRIPTWNEGVFRYRAYFYCRRV